MSLEISKEDLDDSTLETVKLKIEDGEEDDDDDDSVLGVEEDMADDSDAELIEEEEDVDDDEEDDDGDEEVKEEMESKQPPKAPSSLSEMLQTVAIDSTTTSSKSALSGEELSSDDDMAEIDEDYLKKFNTYNREDYILNFHPEQKIHNYNEVEKMSRVSRDKDGNITDPFHKTTPIMSRYEKTKVLGQRAKQIDSGCKIFVNVPANVIDGYLIALEELKQKKLPFIIRRPIPNGGVEYWPVKELAVVN